MNIYLLFLPLLLPLFTAICCLAAWNRLRLQQGIFIAGSLLTLLASIALFMAVWQEGIIHVQLGQWRAPVGITFVADVLSALMVLITAILLFVMSLYARISLRTKQERSGYFPMCLLMIMGIMGALLTGDLFNLYVWFEVMLVAAFVLLVLGGRREQLEGAIKYVVLNILATTLFLAGVGLLYGISGSLNMADLAQRLPQVEPRGLVSLTAVFFIICFGIKSAIFPLFFWLPASYHTPPIAVSSIMAGLLTKVGVYVLIRLFTLIFTHEIAFTHDILLYAAGATMVFGVFGAMVQNDFRKILSFHIISQIGYMIMGLAINTPLALAGCIIFVLHNILVKTNLFLVSGLSYSIQGSYQLKEMGGLYRDYPIVAIFFAISAFSLAGTPPLSGFWGKLMLAQAGLESGDYWIVGVSLFVSLLTMFSMTKIWSNVFLGKMPQRAQEYISQKSLIQRYPGPVAGVSLMVLLILLISFLPQFLGDAAFRAAEQLLNKQGYIESVLGSD